MSNEMMYSPWNLQRGNSLGCPMCYALGRNECYEIDGERCEEDDWFDPYWGPAIKLHDWLLVIGKNEQMLNVLELRKKYEADYEKAREAGCGGSGSIGRD